MGTIVNAANIPLNIIPNGTVPDVSGAIQDRMQPMFFDGVVKNVNGFQVVETTVPIQFFGNIQPFKPNDMKLVPEGQRFWAWYWIEALPGITLQNDDVITFQGSRYRIMYVQQTVQFGYLEYAVVKDWEGSGPSGS